MEKRIPSYRQSAFVLGFSMFIMIIGSIFLKINTNILLCIMAMFATISAMRLGYKWSEIEEAISERIKQTTPVIYMLWIIGMVVGTFMFSGSIPMVIYYGLKIINPQYVILSAFITCMIFSTLTGSSWSSAGTAGVAFMGVAAGLGVPLHITAGAIIAGSIFGDKLSPLSETTNLAPLCAGADIYDHIKAMFWTTLPPSIIAGIVYFIVGSNYSISGDSLPESTLVMMSALDTVYKWNIILIIPFIIILFGSITKKSVVPTLFVASISAILIGILYQGFPIKEGFNSSINGFNSSLIFKGQLPEAVTKLLNRGGMSSMVSVVLVVFCGYAFAVIVSKAGFLDTLFEPLLNKIKTPAQLIIATLITTLVIFLAAGTAYVPFIIVSEMYKKRYDELGLARMTLSRSLEDVGTVTGALIPWTGSGVFYATALQVPIYGALGYGLWTILPYLSPLFAIIWAITGLGVYKLTDEEKIESLKQYNE